MSEKDEHEPCRNVAYEARQMLVVAVGRLLPLTMDVKIGHADIFAAVDCALRAMRRLEDL